jgi:hypothetical protein
MNTSEITDLGIDPLPNRSGSPVRLKSVTIASPPPELHILNVRAYNYTQAKVVVIGSAGDLPTECPHQFRPSPVDSFITPARSTSSWFIVIAFTISKPGRYSVPGLRVDYTTDGRKGWQYLEIDTTVVVHDPPEPGPTPLPSTAVCGLSSSPEPGHPDGSGTSPDRCRPGRGATSSCRPSCPSCPSCSSSPSGSPRFPT